MENLQIQLKEHLCINDLVTLKDSGFSVLRSAHVGNLSPYNLALADAGIPMLLVDHNVTGVDKANAPEFMLTLDSETRLAADGLVSSRARTSDGLFLDQVHMAGIRNALPGASIFTNTEYIRQNETVVGEIARIALRNFPALFERMVLADGRTQKIERASDMVAPLGILQLSDDPRAERASVLMPNLVNIMANFVVEMLLSERDVQYHVAGSKMIGALKGFETDLQQFYESIRQEASFKNKLPDSLKVNIVPGANAIFATTDRYAPELAGMFTCLDESVATLASIALQKKDAFSNGLMPDRRVIAAEFDQRAWAVERQIVEHVAGVPGLLDAPEKRTTVTQYDVVSDNGLFVAAQNMTLTFDELAGVKKRLLGLQKRAGGFAILK